LKSRSLNFLEPSGPVQACNGIASPYWYNVGAELRVVWKLDISVSVPEMSGKFGNLMLEVDGEDNLEPIVCEK
jgi:hypothetical protein